MTLVVSLDTLQLHPRDLAHCRRAGLRDARQIIGKTTTELKGALDKFTDKEGIARIHRAAVVKLAPSLTSVLDTIRATSRARGSKDASNDTASTSQLDMPLNVGLSTSQVSFSTGDEALDNLLGGGVRRGALTEIVGQSGAGKTQIMLQTAVFATLGFHPSSGSQPDLAVLETRNGQSQTEDVFDALCGYGIRDPARRSTVALIMFDGKTEARMLLRRMVEMCDALIEERWMQANAQRKAALQREAKANGGRRSAFTRSEQRRYTLHEAQTLAHNTLHANIKLAVPLFYGMLDHQLQYELPKIAQDLIEREASPLGLVLIDDVTNIIQETAKSVSEKQTESSIERSRLCCELSDSLKHLAVSCNANHQAPAVVVINHVTAVLDRHKEHLLPIVERTLRLEPELGRKASTLQTAQTQALLQAMHSTATNEDSLPLAFHELHFGGAVAQLHTSLFRHSRELIDSGGKHAEVLDGLLSSLRLASLAFSWINCINVRIAVSHTVDTFRLPAAERRRLGRSALKPAHNFGVRRAVSVLNPFAAAGNGQEPSVEYILCPSGVHSLRTLRRTKRPTGHPDVDVELDDDDDDHLWLAVGDEPTLDESEWTAILSVQHSASPPAKRLREG